jgi:hypothetical protein
MLIADLASEVIIHSSAFSGWLVHPGDTQLPMGAHVRSLPFVDL